jgi:hypothetical protein
MVVPESGWQASLYAVLKKAADYYLLAGVVTSTQPACPSCSPRLECPAAVLNITCPQCPLCRVEATWEVWWFCIAVFAFVLGLLLGRNGSRSAAKEEVGPSLEDEALRQVELLKQRRHGNAR